MIEMRLIKYITFIVMTAFGMILLGCGTPSAPSHSDSASWYTYTGETTRWSSPENVNGRKGKGGMSGHGAKGHPSFHLPADSSLDLLHIEGRGIVNRIWITVDDRSPEMLRSLRLEMFWDDANAPAVSVPLGDFFGMGLGKTAKFHNVLFADPEGRSFNCYIPMPFRKGARIRLTNESGRDLSHVFFDVDYQLTRHWDKRNLYFHARWHRDTATTLGKDFEPLPLVHGRGRFLGMNVGINANPLYKKLWWGEGEVKIYLDGDKRWPTLVGTGTEDYIGTAWGQGEFSTDYSGCLLGDYDHLQWAFYRYHIPDPVFFNSDCRVTIQQIGGGPSEAVRQLRQAHVPLIPVTVDRGGDNQSLYRRDSIPNGWTNFYRSDDVSATVYFYLDSPSDGLPALQPVAIRTWNLNGFDGKQP